VSILDASLSILLPSHAAMLVMRFTTHLKDRPGGSSRAGERHSNAAGELVTDLFGDMYEAVRFGRRAAYTSAPACDLREAHAALDFLARLRVEQHQWLPPREIPYLERADGSQHSRPPKLGDSYPGPQQTVPTNGIPVDVSKLQCP